LKEIEKKYLINKKEVPKDLLIDSVKHIKQTYLAIGLEEIRIREIGEDDKSKHTMTVKKGSGLSREEFEFDISKETYEQIMLFVDRKPLQKIRSEIVMDGNKFDLDFYHDSNLATIEIEFDSEKEAYSFVPPKWFGEDVTKDKSYKNQTLWKLVQFK
jgi:adenylate cyclase